MPVQPLLLDQTVADENDSVLTLLQFQWRICQHGQCGDEREGASDDAELHGEDDTEKWFTYDWSS
jgi:hypothetical protein